MPRANTQPVRINSALIAEIEDAATTSKRSVPMEIEYRLKRSLTADSIDTLPTWPRAIAQLTGLLAKQVASHSESADEALAIMKSAAPSLFDELLKTFSAAAGHDTTLSSEDVEWSDSEARWVAKKIIQAHKSENNDEVSYKDLWSQAARRFEEHHTSLPNKHTLQKIQEALLLSPEALKKLKEAVRKSAK